MCRLEQRLCGFPGDLEGILASFKGRFSITEDEARWEAFAARGSP